MNEVPLILGYGKVPDVRGPRPGLGRVYRVGEGTSGVSRREWRTDQEISSVKVEFRKQEWRSTNKRTEQGREFTVEGSLRRG